MQNTNMTITAVLHTVPVAFIRLFCNDVRSGLQIKARYNSPICIMYLQLSIFAVISTFVYSVWYSMPCLVICLVIYICTRYVGRLQGEFIRWPDKELQEQGKGRQNIDSHHELKGDFCRYKLPVTKEGQNVPRG